MLTGNLHIALMFPGRRSGTKQQRADACLAFGSRGCGSVVGIEVSERS